MPHLMRREIDEKMIQSEGDGDVDLFAVHEKRFIEKVERSPWKLFGHLNERISTTRFLKDYSTRLLKGAGQGGEQLASSLEEMIESYKEKIPLEVNRFHHEGNRTMEQAYGRACRKGGRARGG